MAETPLQCIHEPHKHAIIRDHVLSPLQQWIEEKSKNGAYYRSSLLWSGTQVFMNAIDRINQYWSTAATVWREKGVTMSIFTFVLDDCIINSHAVFRSITEPGAPISDMFELKQKVFKSSMNEHVE